MKTTDGRETTSISTTTMMMVKLIRMGFVPLIGRGKAMRKHPKMSTVFKYMYYQYIP